MYSSINVTHKVLTYLRASHGQRARVSELNSISSKLLIRILRAAGETTLGVRLVCYRSANYLPVSKVHSIQFPSCLVFVYYSYFLRGYSYNKNGRLENTPYVDLSYKWAGGGYLSTVGDIIKFGNAMLYSYQCSNQTGKRQSPECTKIV